MQWKEAKDIKKQIKDLVEELGFAHVDCKRIICFRSFGSTSRAKARIWSFPRVWQQALSLPAHYIIEVISNNYDVMSKEEKTKTLIHELLHIPKNFSGSLLAHKTRYSRINSRQVEKLYKSLKKIKT